MNNSKKSISRFAVVACGVMAAGLSLCANAADAGGPAGDAARGKQLYYAHGCYGCHGFNGETGARKLVGTGSAIVQDQTVFITFLRLRSELAPMTPAATMPSYRATTLSDAKARDIFAYIRTFQLHAPDPKTVPTLQKIIESGKTPYKPMPKGAE